MYSGYAGNAASTINEKMELDNVTSSLRSYVIINYSQGKFAYRAIWLAKLRSYPFYHPIPLHTYSTNFVIANGNIIT